MKELSNIGRTQQKLIPNSSLYTSDAGVSCFVSAAEFVSTGHRKDADVQPEDNSERLNLVPDLLASDTMQADRCADYRFMAFPKAHTRVVPKSRF